MSLDTENKFCAKCSRNTSVAKCFGCQHSFCTKHFIKHRLYLGQQMDELSKKQELLQQDLDRNTFEHPLLTSIYAWERKSMRKIQEIAEKARSDLHEWTERTSNEVQHSLNQINEQLCSHDKSDNYTEVDLQKWTKQLDALRNLLEKPSTIVVVEEEKLPTHIGTIKVIDLQSTSQKSADTAQEHFVKMYGPCELSEEDRIVTHSCYRAGLSQICGTNQYSSGKHAIEFFIKKKGVKNMFIGIVSSSRQIISSTFDYSVHGWWNLKHTIVNGESKISDVNEGIQSGDKITLIIDCDNRQIQLAHHRTGNLVHLPIKLEVCPFPWKILIRLLASGDSIRILG